jgi:large subunit ribosomal protein L6
MSIILYKNTTLTLTNQKLSVKGSYGTADFFLSSKTSNLPFKKKKTLEMFIQKKLSGLNAGYVKRMIVSGVGYKFFIENNAFIFALGYSHLFKVAIPKKIKVYCDEKASEFFLWSSDFQELAFFAAALKNLKRLDKYKGKGVRDGNFFFIKKEIKKK